MHHKPSICAMSTPETGVIDLLKQLRIRICCESRSSLRLLIPVYEHLLSPRGNSDNSVERDLLNIRAQLLEFNGHPIVVDVVDRMDQVIDQCLRIKEKQQSGPSPIPIDEMMRLLVDLAGGKDGKTFLFEESQMQYFEAKKKRMGDRIRINDIYMMQRLKALFRKAPISLNEEAHYSQNLFTSFGNGLSDQHSSLWCPEKQITEDKGVSKMKPFKQLNQFFCLPGVPPLHNPFDQSTTPLDDEHERQLSPHASRMMKSGGCARTVLPGNDVLFYDSIHKLHCGDEEQQKTWGIACDITEDSSSDRDCKFDTIEPWVARTYAWEELGNRIGLPENYCKPPNRKAKRSLHDLLIPHKFASSGDSEKLLLEIHEVDLIEDALRALSGIDSTIFRRHIQSATFQLPEKHRVKLRKTSVSATTSVLEVFRKAGTTLMRLELLAIYYSQDSNRGGKTLQIMGEALQQYLSMHRTIVETIAQQCLPSCELEQDNDIVSITKLLYETSNACRVLDILGHVFCCDNDVFWPLLQQDKFPRGVALLNHLYTHVFSLRTKDASGNVHKLVVWFLVKACSPLLATLSDLISLGRVDETTDPFDEFSITTWSRHLLERAGVGGGDGLLSDEMSTEEVQMLPTFMEKIASSIIHVSQVQALLQSINAKASFNLLVDVQPLVLFFHTSQATKYAEKWYTVMDEAMRLKEITPYAVSAENQNSISTERPPAADRIQNVDCEDIDARFRHDGKTSFIEQKACSRKALFQKDSELAGDTAEQHYYMRWRRSRALRLSTAKVQLQSLEVKETDQWSTAKINDTEKPRQPDVTKMSLSVDKTDATNSADVGKPTIATEQSAVSAKDKSSRTSDRQTRSRNSGAFKTRALNEIRDLNITDIGESDPLGSPYGRFCESLTKRSRYEASIDDNGVKTSVADNVEMRSSDQVVRLADDVMGKGVHPISDGDNEDTLEPGRSDWNEEPLSKVRESVTNKYKRVILPSVHPYFSTTIPKEDLEVLTRALDWNASEPHFTSFSSIVNCCVEIPVRLLSQKLDKVAVDWFRNSLQVLEHLLWLRKLMLMSEGLCMDIFARDFLLGLRSATRVNWGMDGRLLSALMLAMSESSVSTDSIAQNFYYKTSSHLTQVLCSRTMTPTVSNLLNEIELVYDVKWPLGLVITSRSLEKYKQMHQFLLHVRLTSLEMREAWRMLRIIRQQRQISSTLEQLCGRLIYKMQTFLQAFNETFARKVFMSAWLKLEHSVRQATTVSELRQCHEEYVSVALHCSFLDTPAIAIHTAILSILTVAWKLIGFMRGLEHQVARISAEVHVSTLCEELDGTLVALVASLYNVTRDAEWNAREFSEVRKLLDRLLLALEFS